jgi:hypothetical protein
MGSRREGASGIEGTDSVSDKHMAAIISTRMMEEVLTAFAVQIDSPILIVSTQEERHVLLPSIHTLLYLVTFSSSPICPSTPWRKITSNFTSAEDRS